MPHTIQRRHLLGGASLLPLASLSGCLAFTGPDEEPGIVKSRRVRTNEEGFKEVWTPETGWRVEKLPEVNIKRLPVWHMVLRDSGFRALRYGFESAQTHNYLDPQSPIVGVCDVSATGWATYLIKGDGEKDFVVRKVDFTRGGQPQTLGVLQRFRGEWRFATGKGPAVACNAHHLTSRGIVLLRSTNAFAYVPSANEAPRLLPKDWYLAWIQKADLELTRLVLVVKHIPRRLDAGRYAVGFFDVDQGRLLPTTFEVSFVPGHEAAQFKNRFYLYETTQGPLCIARNDGLKEVVVMNLKTGQRRLAHRREDGISHSLAERLNTGRIELNTAVGFKDETIYDVEHFLNTGERNAPAA